MRPVIAKMKRKVNYKLYVLSRHKPAVNKVKTSRVTLCCVYKRLAKLLSSA